MHKDSRLYIFIVGLFFLSPEFSYAGDACLSWFQNSGLIPGSKSCVLNCDVLPKDMSTFTCADKCDVFCKPKKCSFDPYWQDKIKTGRPIDWDLPTETSTPWNEAENKQLLEFLSRLPNQLKTISFEGFYRMKKSVYLTNPATTNRAGNAIVIYDRAFDNPSASTLQVLTHELGHVIYINFKKAERQDYQNILKWSQGPDQSNFRPGDFISSRAREDANEDFAENFSFFLLDPSKLEKTVPSAYQWIYKKFSKNFKLKESCLDEKK